MLDIQNIFTYNSDTGAIDQAITGNAASQSYIDLKVANLQIANTGKPVRLIGKVTQAFNLCTSLEIFLETDTNPNFATAKKQVFIARFLRTADLVTVGKTIIDIPLPNQKYQRYAQGYFKVWGTSPSTGRILLALTDAPEAAESQIDLVEAAS